MLLLWSLEDERDRIDAMARVFGRKPFVLKNMSQMRLAGVAEDFRAPTVTVFFALDRLRDFIVETRPTATGMKLVL